MKKIVFVLLTLTSTIFCLEAAKNTNAGYYSNKADTSTAQEKYDIMRRDQVEPTDSLAIPLDDSEIEDEEEIDRAQGRDVFPLPHSR